MPRCGSVVIAKASTIKIKTTSSPVEFGQSIAVVSNASQWKNPAQLQWSEGDVWEGEVEVDGVDTLEFKLVKVADGEVCVGLGERRFPARLFNSHARSFAR